MNKRILIVDDETNVRLNFRTTLETEGYQIFEARSGEEAIQSLAEHTFALAILDIRMAGMEGFKAVTGTARPISMSPLVLVMLSENL